MSSSVDLSGPLPGVEFTVRDAVAFVTLARPQRGNALTPAMHPVFRAIWRAVRDEPGIRAAVIGARGERHFCTGFDVDEAGSDQAGEVFRDAPFAESVHWSPYQNGVWKPVICAVTGLCVGGGHHFVVDSDIVVASRNAAFMDTHVEVGMVGAIENLGLARRLPLGAALRMTLMGSRYRMPASRAHALGLVDELLETPDDARAAAEEMARAIVRHSPQALSRSKRAVWGGLERGYGEALEAGWEQVRAHWSHPDFAEGPRAFAERRPPRWNPDPDARARDEDDA